jgi:hypothetical protein
MLNQPLLEFCLTRKNEEVQSLESGQVGMSPAPKGL